MFAEYLCFVVCFRPVRIAAGLFLAMLVTFVAFAAAAIAGHIVDVRNFL
jgi:hypothetical protein